MNNLDSAIIHEIAAQLFWGMAADAGVGSATDLVLSTGGEVLFQQARASRVVNGIISGGINESDVNELILRVRADCLEMLNSGNQPLGVINKEDAETCVSPEARFVNAKCLDFQPSNLSVRGYYEEIGALCLRHPLPAICFSTRPNQRSIVKIAETKRALGFSLPIFMLYPSTHKVDNNLYCLAGNMYVPVPSDLVGRSWDRVIPNSTRFVDGFTCKLPDGSFSVSVDWPNRMVKSEASDSASSIYGKISPDVLREFFDRLFFLADLEPAEHSVDEMEIYLRNVKNNQVKHDESMEFLKAFARHKALGRQLSLCEMQSIYYEVSSGNEFGSTHRAIAASAHLKAAWNGVGEWRN